MTAVIAGGKERYHSVYEGLKAAGACDYVLIHDGARPCITIDMIQTAIEESKKEQSLRHWHAGEGYHKDIQ